MSHQGDSTSFQWCDDLYGKHSSRSFGRYVVDVEMCRTGCQDVDAVRGKLSLSILRLKTC